MTNKLFKYKIIIGDNGACRGPAHFAKTRMEQQPDVNSETLRMQL